VGDASTARNTLSGLRDEVEEMSKTHGTLGSVRLCFRVVDSGIGIPESFLPALFEPYTQAKRGITRNHGGTGLGLAIVKRLCEMHAGGAIEVESTVGVGTTFSFSADFLVAKAPTPAMAMLLRRVSTMPSEMEIGQIRRDNFYTMHYQEKEHEEDKQREDRSVPPPASSAPSSTTGGVLVTRRSSVRRCFSPVGEERGTPHSEAQPSPDPDGVVPLQLPEMDLVPPQERRRRAESMASQSQSAQPSPVTFAAHPSAAVLTPSPLGMPASSVSVLSSVPSAARVLLDSAIAPSAAVDPKRHLLIVDDAKINLKILHKMLAAEYHVDQAENGLEAVNLVDANPNKYCCVLMDLMMVRRGRGASARNICGTNVAVCVRTLC
jgi:CheY-like chemotaxis protein